MPLAEIGILGLGKGSRQLKRKEIEDRLGKDHLKQLRKDHAGRCLVFYESCTGALVVDVYDFVNTVFPNE